jgi:hypothetical protein
MKKAFTFILLLAFQLTIFAGNPGNDVMFVSGNVIDKQTHESLAGVQVRVKGTNIVAYTDFNGNFFLPDLPRGSYELQFNYITYAANQFITDNCDHCSALTVEMQQN